uniref:Uncharacterized protein n=1 Tax=Bosea sp. NBC_00436 TaxID=2969620 RepID=A0A9E8CR97_9HYPH
MFIVLPNVDDAPKQDAVGCLVHGIGELAFEADRGVGEDRNTREAVPPFAKLKSVRARIVRRQMI